MFWEYYTQLAHAWEVADMVHSSTINLNFSGYCILEQLYSGSRTEVYRAMRDGTAVSEAHGQPVIIKLLKRQYPTAAELVQFRNQYAIAKNLDSPGIIKPYSLEPYRNGYALVMEDFGGVSLREWMKQRSEEGRGDRGDGGDRTPSPSSPPSPPLHPAVSLSDFFTIALQLVETLHQLHQQRVIHKDIKPANILIHPETHQIKLIDFSISTLLPRETQQIQSFNTLEGTLAYLSPEQTGRMNRGVDYRSDFYSLGITFYELLTGQLPFQSSDPAELVHCHLARQPVSPHQLYRGAARTEETSEIKNQKTSEILQSKVQNPKSKIQNPSSVPEALSQIVMKLMSKNAEDRYQSALGLKCDLEHCLHQWQVLGQIERFELGRQDIVDRFLIPEKLYGREQEVAELLAAFERVSGVGNGAMGNGEEASPTPHSELILVAGYSGIGKTAIVNEVHKPNVRQRGYFIKGKYDQFQRNIPFSAFVQAFRDLIRQLLSESDAQLSAWKAKILAAVGENGQVLIEVIPELEQIIDKQQPVPELVGSAAQNRFNSVFQQFIQIFTAPAHPLVMFLDDLQWADFASLQLIKLLISETETGHLLIIGAYRDNEVSSTHPLTLTLNEIARAAAVNIITLAALSQTDVSYLVADTLSCSPEQVQPLVKLIYQKTQGNPFFTTQFLKALYEEGAITFTPAALPKRESLQSTVEAIGGWRCDMAQVKALALTEDIVEFMALQLQKLPAETQAVLQLAACIGNQFDLTTLAIVDEQPAAETASSLWRALQEGLILPTNEIYKFYQENVDGSLTAIQEQTSTPSLIIYQQFPTYKFLHDRVQQAAYSLIPPDQKQTTHLKIGQLLLHSGLQAEEKIFDVVNHLNLGIELVTDPQQRIHLAELNLTAGRKALTSTAYAAATKYFETGMTLLPPDGWSSQYNLALSLYEAAVEAEYLNVNFARAQTLANLVLQHTPSPLDRIKVYELQIQMYMAQAEMPKALEAGLFALKLLQVDLDHAPALQAVQLPSLTELEFLPAMTDRHQLAAMRLLAALLPPAYTTKPELLPRMVMTLVDLSRQHGQTSLSALAYVYCGLLLCGLERKLETGYDSGLLALDVLQRFSAKELDCKVNNLFNVFIKPWKQPLRDTIEPLVRASQIGFETGDHEYASYATTHSCTHRFLAGEPLEEVQHRQTIALDVLLKTRQDHSIYHAKIWQQLVCNLLGEAADLWQLTGGSFDEAKLLPIFCAGNDRTLPFVAYLAKCILNYLFEDYQSAVIYATEAASYADAVTGFITVGIHNFYYSLSLLVQCNNLLKTEYAGESFNAESLPEKCQEILQQVDKNQKFMQEWMAYAPANFEHKYNLVEAEKAQVLNYKTLAVDLYDRAIALAKTHKYLQEEALSNELAARFYLSWDKPRIAQDYLINAYYGYTRWGAKAKVAELEQHYPQLLAPILQQVQPSLLPLETIAVTDGASLHPSTTAYTSSSSGASIALDLETVLKASQTLSREIQLDKLVCKLLEVLIESAGAEKCALMLMQDHRLLLMAVNSTMAGSTTLEAVPAESSQEVPIGLVNAVKRNLQLTVIADAIQHPLFAADPYIQQHQSRSLLCTPILYQGKLLGVLYLENNLTKGAFTSDRVELLNLLCTQAAISIENARLYEKAQVYAQSLERSLAGQELMFDLVCDIRRSLEVNTISTVVTQRVREILQADRVIIHQFDLADAYNTGEIVAEAVLPEFPSALHAKVEDHCFGERYAKYYQQGRVYALPDLDQVDVMPCYRQVLQQFAIKADLAAPILWRGELWGLLCVHQCRQPRHWTDDEIQFTRQIAAQLSVALEQAKLLSQTHEQATQLELALQNLQQTQVQLVQNEKMSALGNLVAGVAHEINNPVGFIAGNIKPAKDYVQDLLGLIDLYQETYPDPAPAIDDEIAAIDLEYVREDLPKLIDSMKLGVDRIRDISTSLRTFSRADKDYKVPFDIHEGIDSTILILKHRLKANEQRPAIEIVKKYGDLPQIGCFPGQLNQVFMNILANAIDALEEASQNHSFADLQANPNRIEIQTNLNNSGTEAIIRIRDNGIGMPAEVKERVFDHLFTTKGVGKGTGLGLAIAQKIVVEKHGGSVAVESAIDQGTTFVISLPKCEVTSYLDQSLAV